MIRHLLCIAAASALLAPAVPRAAPAAPLSMGVEVGGGIKTVSATIAAFESNYPKPVATLWRSPINDMLQTTHLSVVNQDFKYDALFGYGFLTLMDLIMGTYPVAGEGDKITDALISALDFDPQQVRSDSAAIKAAVWACASAVNKNVHTSDIKSSHNSALFLDKSLFSGGLHVFVACIPALVTHVTRLKQ